jgi:hypothetical protein
MFFIWPIFAPRQQQQKKKKKKKRSAKCIKGFDSHQYWVQCFSFGQFLHHSNKNMKKKGVMCIKGL